MDNLQFTNALKRNRTQVIRYITDQAPGMVIRKTLRFIDGNFRGGGWQGNGFNKWAANAKGTTTLIKTGALRRSFNYNSAGAGAVRFYSNVTYGYGFNRGFKGTVQIKAHTRSKYQVGKIYSINEFRRDGKTRKSRNVTNKIGEGTVKAHTRKVDIKQRQFAPYEGHESQTLNKSIIREIERELRQLLTN